MEIAFGTTLGSYSVFERLGEGGMGIVHRALDTRLNRHVAIKILPSSIATDLNARERMRREAIAAASLDHPYVCKIFEIGAVDDAIFLVMEFVDGETLHQRMHRERMHLFDALEVVREVAEALEDAHRHRILHRDLKPSNIMLTAQGHVKVMDFGLAKMIGGSRSGDDETLSTAQGQITAPGTIVGTPDYMSPEQISCRALDARSDQFSLGVILAEILCGNHPFRRPTTLETFSAILREPPDLRGDMPQSLRVVVRRMLARNPEERFVSMQEVHAELGRMSAVAESSVEANEERRLPPIGRDVELKLLSKHVEQAIGGRGSVVLISGEPGIGKTHLVTAAAEAAQMLGALVRIGHCYEAEGSPPYTPYIEMLEDIIRTGSTGNLRFALGEDAAEIARIMPELRTVFSDIPEPIEVPPEHQRRLLFGAFRSFLARAARLTPILYIFEDLHWADEPTLLLLEHVAKHLSDLSILIVITYRDVELDVGRPFARTLGARLSNGRDQITVAGVGCFRRSGPSAPRSPCLTRGI